MARGLNNYIGEYKKVLEEGDVPVAYAALVKYVMALRARFAKELQDDYTVGNVSPGYMDYTYFPFFNGFLRAEKLRFGVVLNHCAMRFELWLMGQNATVQDTYWALLKDTPWNEGKTERPQYSVLEAVLVKEPDFDDLSGLADEITQAAAATAADILAHLSAQ